MKDQKKEKKQNAPDLPTEGEQHDRANTDVESDTGKRPEKDTNPLPPNPNKVDNHEDEDN